jgi:hypothetical protein
MSQQIITDHNVDALKVAASWPGADRATLVTLATVLAATGADHDGLTFFEALAASQPDQLLPLALAGYFQVRAGENIPAGLAKLDDAASIDLGLAQYYRGLALAALPAGAGHAEQAVTETGRDSNPSMRPIGRQRSTCWPTAGQSRSPRPRGPCWPSATPHSLWRSSPPDWQGTRTPASWHSCGSRPSTGSWSGTSCRTHSTSSSTPSKQESKSARSPQPESADGQTGGPRAEPSRSAWATGRNGVAVIRPELGDPAA